MKFPEKRTLLRLITGGLALATLVLWLLFVLDRDRLEDRVLFDLSARRNALASRMEALVRAERARLAALDIDDRGYPPGVFWEMATEPGSALGSQVGEENLYTSVTVAEEPRIYVGMRQRESVFLYSRLPLAPVLGAMRELCPADQGRVYITNTSGQPVLQWPPLFDGPDATEHRKFRLKSVATESLARGEAGEARYKNLDDVEALGAFSHSEAFHGGVVVEITERVAFAPVSGVHAWQVTGGLTLIAAIALLFVMIAPRMNLASDLFRLYAYAKRYWILIGVTFVLMGVYASGNMVRLTLMEKVFDDVLLGKGEGALEALRWVVSVFGVIVLVMATAHWIKVYLVQWVNQSIVNDLRLDMATRLLALDMRFFDRQRAGELLSRLANDVGLAQHSLGLIFGEFLQQPLMLVGALTAAFVTNWRLTLMIAFGLPVIIFPIYRLGRLVKKHSRRRQVQQGVVTEVMLQSVTGVRTVKAFQMEEEEHKKLKKANRELLKQSIRVGRTTALARTLVEVMNSFAGLLVVGFGSYMVIRGIAGATPAQLATLTVIMAQMYKPVKEVTRTYNKIQESMAGVERIFEIMDREPSIADRPDAVELEEPRREVSFRDVSFAYDETPVLRNIDFSVSVGEVVALVGETGSGKSTLTDLVARFYDPTEGRVEIDGADLRDYTIRSVRRAIATVTQDAFLFNTTIRQNILCARPDATPEEVEAAARAAEIHDEILKMDGGYEAEVGDRGVRLSGGQRQRITIARAILKGSPILILDEATSALDSQTEALVQEALDRLMEERTTFVIAHRLSTIRHADRILVLKDGVLVEQGTHAELLARPDGVYHALHQIQFAGANGP